MYNNIIIQIECWDGNVPQLLSKIAEAFGDKDGERLKTEVSPTPHHQIPLTRVQPLPVAVGMRMLGDGVESLGHLLQLSEETLLSYGMSHRQIFALAQWVQEGGAVEPVRPPQPPSREVMTGRQVMAYLNISTAKLRYLYNDKDPHYDPEFPKPHVPDGPPVRGGNRTYFWYKDEIDVWARKNPQGAVARHIQRGKPRPKNGDLFGGEPS